MPPVAQQPPCQVCGVRLPKQNMLQGGAVRPAVADRIRVDHPDFDPSGFICLSCSARYRAELVRTMLKEERGELSRLDEQVVTALRDEETVAANVNDEFADRLTFGERTADRVASFGGSWTFILIFAAILAVWMTFNRVTFSDAPFDPFPFILLNLVLSALAALQAPVIMMSQNRQGAKDRLQAEHDYRVNLKAELEIRLLHAKIDQLLTHQWQRLLEIQELQMDVMEELRQSPPRSQ